MKNLETYKSDLDKLNQIKNYIQNYKVVYKMGTG